MLQIKNLTQFSLIAFIVVMAAAAPLKLHAQDDMPSGDEDTFVPPPPTQPTNTPPTIIDESDSGGVSDVEEYDG